MSYRIKKKKLNILWPLSFLKFCLPFFSVCFFGQSFLLLTTIFDCQKGFTYVSKELVCRTGIWFSIDAPLSAIAMALHAILALITNTLYYKSTFIKNGSDVLKKTNCYPDIVLLFTKIFVIVLFILDDGVEDEHWAILFFLILSTGSNTLCNFYFQNRQNIKLNYLNNILCLMPFFGFCSLLIGKIFKFCGFNGSIFLFFSWIIFGILIILLYKKKDMDFALINHKEIENPTNFLNYIHQFYKIVINKNNSRNDFTILKSLIAKKEEKCFDSQCPLKKYNENSLNETDDIFPLLQFCEILFKYGISKFPNDISLKINYSMFLIFNMNHNKKALITLTNINTSLFAFQDNYNIYRCEKLIDEYIANKNKNKNIAHSFEYKKRVHDFKILSSKATSLYYDFWTLIIINKLNVTDNLDELSKIGSEILKLNKKLDAEYESLIKIKSDNYDLIRFYSFFTENVLNDQEKFKKFNVKISNSSFTKNNISDSQEIHFSNFDINILKERDIFKYMILSGNKKTLANIIEISTNLCPIFGYNKSELLGKNINYLIPELLHKAHDKLLYNLNEKSITNFYKELFNNDNYIPEYIEITVYAISKSKFLIPIKLKMYFVQTEGSEFVYITEVKKIKDYQIVLENNNKLKCVVLTDENFYIQTFTSNCVNKLKLNDSYINASYNIINYIKQFRNEYIKKINEAVKIFSLNSTIKNYSFKESSDRKHNRNINFDNISFTERKRLKNELIDNKYLEENEITWRIDINNNLRKPSDNNIFKHSIINNKDTYLMNNNNNNYYEDEFLMEIKKIIIFKELVGYYFIFSSESKEVLNKNNFITINISNLNDQKRKSITKQKKYKYYLQSKPAAIIKKNSIVLQKTELKIKRCASPRKMVKYKSFDNDDFFNNKQKTNESLSNTFKMKHRSSKTIEDKFDTDINNINDDKDNVTINEEYIPDCPFNFIFDISNRTFEPCYDIIKENEKVLNDALQLQASKKIKSYQQLLKKKKNTKIYTNTYSQESEEDSEYENKESSSSPSFNSDETSSNNENQNQNQSPKNIQKFASYKNKTNNKNNINDIEINNENHSENQKIKPHQSKKDLLNNFYKVNFNKINFCIYDFNKDMVIDVPFDKISKIEEVLLKKLKPEDISVDINKGEEIANIISKIIDDDKKKDNISKINIINNKVKKEKITDDKIIKNKIMEEIDKDSNEDNNSRIYKYSFILVMILIISSCLYLYYELISHKDFMTNLNIIKNIITINYCNKIGFYFVRELTLLNVPDTEIKGGQYLLIPAKNRTKYKDLVKRNILEFFVESQLAMSDFIGVTFPISKSSESFLSQTKLETKLSDSDLKASIVKNNIIITLVQLNSAFYNLASSTSPVEQNHADLYNFLYNSLNNFGVAINILIDTYNKELNSIIDYYVLIFYILLIICFFIYITSYVIALIFYSKVIRRKKCYMKIFLNLNFDFITFSINKCEQFINKYKISEEVKQDDDDDEIEESLDEKANLIPKGKTFNEQNINLKYKSSIIQGKNKKKKKFKCSKHLFFKSFFGISLFLLYIYFFVYGFIYFNTLKNNVKDISKFYFHLQQYHLNIMEYYNIFREYLFDNGSIILNTTPYENLIEKEKTIYGNWTDNVNNITLLTKTLISDKDIVDKINKSLCSYNITDYFNSEEECISIVGNSYDQDINTFIYGFVDEIRIKKNIIKILLESDIIKGNLTEYQTGKWKEKYYDLFNEEKNEDIKTKIRFRLELFNDGYFHCISNIYFINIILPCLNHNRKIIFDYLTIEGRQNGYYIILTLFLLVILSIYFFYWIPMIKRLNQITYEIKSMLKIIPIHILMNDMNLKNLLNISNKNN